MLYILQVKLNFKTKVQFIKLLTDFNKILKTHRLMCF
jgi:hypothetical protein